MGLQNDFLKLALNDKYVKKPQDLALISKQWHVKKLISMSMLKRNKKCAF
jgi:hypothetical protein